MPAGALEEEGVSLYVHLPFCVRKCRYCDFNSYVWSGQSLERHVAAVLRETEARATDLRPQTVFLGGGTPTFLPADLLAELLEGLDRITAFRAAASEVTMEANPESFDAATAEAARRGGVNRVSLGVQSLQDDVLNAYDRVHNGAQALEAFARAREAGFERVNVDLIYAFPGQDPVTWECDLGAILDLQPEHLSAYELSYEPGTALTRLRDAGRWEPADSDAGRALFDRTRRICAERGYGQYEISNYARPAEACRHNLAYWRSLEYVGVGAGAASWRDGERRKNILRPEQYEAAVIAGTGQVEESERPGPATTLFDAYMMALRLVDEGVQLERARRISGTDEQAVFGPALSALIEEGLLEPAHDGAALRATPQGLPFLDSLLHRLLDALD